jgi:tripartite-type tricarboxylate transporter receptor subunit TctC
MKRRTVLSATAGAALWPSLAPAQDKYPSKLITWICPCAAGGNADNCSR